MADFRNYAELGYVNAAFTASIRYKKSNMELIDSLIYTRFLCNGVKLNRVNRAFSSRRAM